MTSPIWRKSSYSSDGTMAQCVEVAELPGVIGIRDGKDPGRGHLSVERDRFAALLHQVKKDDFSR